jgi:hypothetical protein
MSESLQEKRVPELCLNNNQMECVIAAILTVGSLAGQGASADKAVSLYAETLKHLRIKCPTQNRIDRIKHAPLA